MVCEHVLQHWLLQKKSIATQSNIDSGRTSGSRLTEGRDSVAGPSRWQHTWEEERTDGAISNLNLFMSWWPMRLLNFTTAKETTYSYTHKKDSWYIDTWLSDGYPHTVPKKKWWFEGWQLQLRKLLYIFFSLGTRTRCLLSGPCNLAYRVWDLPARYRKMLSLFQHFPWYESPIPVLRRLPCSQRTARPADTPSNIY